MAVWIWLGIGLLVVLVLLAAWTVDRRGRGSGHARSVKDISRDLREQNRDNRVVDAQGYVDTGGTGSTGRAGPATAPECQTGPASALPCPASRSVPARGGPERRRPPPGPLPQSCR